MNAAAVQPFAYAMLRTAAAVVGVALFIVTFDNDAFWTAVLRATEADTDRGAIIATLYAIQVCGLAAVLAVTIGRAFKPVAVALLVLAAFAGYFMSQFGVVIDESMIRNAVETNAREAAPLLSGGLLFHMTFFGLAPAALVLFAPLRADWRPALTARGLILVSSLLALVGVVRVNYGPVSYFAGENHRIRLLMNPSYPLYAAARYAWSSAVAPVPATPALLDLHRVGAAARRTVLVLVIGETARADRFGWNGYSRDTNPYTRELEVLNFPHVTACGTSTAESVPCMFAPFGRREFGHSAFAATENLFQALNRLGVVSAWRDNSTGCKGVCDAAHFVELAGENDGDLCDSTGCFDEILLRDFATELEDTAKDHFIVLHQRGSHGPAYHTDTPAWIKTFLPECDLANPRNCSAEAIDNAYDNTILYTDYFLAKVVERLAARGEAYDVAMLYVSDHGESLGENGLYLHGFPYAIAPPEQTRVPMLFWANPSFYAHRGIDKACMERSTAAELSHDNVFYTVLGLFDLAITPARTDLDLFAPCRAPRTSSSAAPDAPKSAA